MDEMTLIDSKDMLILCANLVKACDTLMDEVTGHDVTNWGIVNEALVKARNILPPGLKNLDEPTEAKGLSDKVPRETLAVDCFGDSKFLHLATMLCFFEFSLHSEITLFQLQFCCFELPFLLFELHISLFYFHVHLLGLLLKLHILLLGLHFHLLP